jgi:sulfatase modifying factor 1
MTPQWVLVPGGKCRYGDDARPRPVSPLCWTATPVTRRQLGIPGRGGGLPVTAISQPDAQAIAASFGGRLPTSAEWEWMAAGPARRRYPWGDGDWHPGLAVLRPGGKPAPLPAGSCPAGATPDGLLDVAGNAWEWTASRVLGGGFIIRGGSYASPPLYARTRFINAAPAELRSPGIGVRVVRQP